MLSYLLLRLRSLGPPVSSFVLLSYGRNPAHVLFLLPLACLSISTNLHFSVRQLSSLKTLHNPCQSSHFIYQRFPKSPIISTFSTRTASYRLHPDQEPFTALTLLQSDQALIRLVCMAQKLQHQWSSPGSDPAWGCKLPTPHMSCSRTPVSSRHGASSQHIRIIHLYRTYHRVRLLDFIEEL